MLLWDTVKSLEILSFQTLKLEFSVHLEVKPAIFFFPDSRLNQVLEWEHDLTILWIGNNDINADANPLDIYNDIKEIYKEIETNCQSVVYICQVEPRVHARDIPAEIYKRIQYGLNNRIKRSLKTPNIHYNNVSFVEELSGDGVH